MYIAPGVQVTATNILLQNGDATSAGNGTNGGGVFNEGTFSLVNSWVQENTANFGAGLYNEGELILEETAVLTNTAQTHGGGLYNNGDADLVGSEFRNNQTSQHGGAIYHAAGTLFLDRNHIHRNGFSSISGSHGGGIYLNSGNANRIDIRNNFIFKNQAETGGGLYNVNTDMFLWHNTFINNTANSDDGAGIATLGGAPDIRNNIVDNNFGSGIYARTGTPTH